MLWVISRLLASLSGVSDSPRKALQSAFQCAPLSVERHILWLSEFGVPTRANEPFRKGCYLVTSFDVVFFLYIQRTNSQRLSLQSGKISFNRWRCSVNFYRFRQRQFLNRSVGRIQSPPHAYACILDCALIPFDMNDISALLFIARLSLFVSPDISSFSFKLIFDQKKFANLLLLNNLVRCFF